MDLYSGRRARTATAAVVSAALLVLAALAPATVGAADAYRDCSTLTPGPNVRMHRCDLPDLVIIGQDVHGIDFSWSNLPRLDAGCHPDFARTDLTGSRIARATVTDARLCDAILDGSDLHGTDFTGGDFEDSDFDEVNLSWSDLSGSRAGHSNFRDSNLANAAWRDGIAYGSNFDRSDLHRIDFRGTDLSGATFTGADLRYARLDGADLTNADLSGAAWRHATGADLAVWSNTTCPDGTNSDANGGTCVGH